MGIHYLLINEVAKMSGKRWAALFIAIVIFAASLMINLASSLLSKDFQSFFKDMTLLDEDFIEEVVEQGTSLDKIALIELDGVIQDTGEIVSLFSDGYHHQTFMKKLNYVKDNNSINGLVIRVNTPGGGVVESAEIHDKIVEIVEEAEKPVYISMGGMAASGGYYVSAPATKIVATPATITGSLGVIMQSVNYSELAEKMGVDFVTIKSGEHKDILSPTREMTAEEADILQNMLNNSYEQFVDVIANGRGLDDQVVRELADGRIYDGQQAKELNLVDDFGYLEDVIEMIREEQDLAGAEVVRLSENLAFGFNSLFKAGTQKVFKSEYELSGVVQLLSKPNSPRPLYLYAE